MLFCRHFAIYFGKQIYLSALTFEQFKWGFIHSRTGLNNSVYFQTKQIILENGFAYRNHHGLQAKGNQTLFVKRYINSSSHCLKLSKHDRVFRRHRNSQHFDSVFYFWYAGLCLATILNIFEAHCQPRGDKASYSDYISSYVPNHLFVLKLNSLVLWWAFWAAESHVPRQCVSPEDPQYKLRVRRWVSIKILLIFIYSNSYLYRSKLCKGKSLKNSEIFGAKLTFNC